MLSPKLSVASSATINRAGYMYITVATIYIPFVFTIACLALCVALGTKEDYICLLSVKREQTVAYIQHLTWPNINSLIHKYLQ